MPNLESLLQSLFGSQLNLRLHLARLTSELRNGVFKVGSSLRDDSGSYLTRLLAVGIEIFRGSSRGQDFKHGPVSKQPQYVLRSTCPLISLY